MKGRGNRLEHAAAGQSSNERKVRWMGPGRREEECTVRVSLLAKRANGSVAVEDRWVCVQRPILLTLYSFAIAHRCRPALVTGRVLFPTLKLSS